MENVIKDLFNKHNIEISDEQCDMLNKYLEMLTVENTKYNLTAITDSKQVIVKHFIDSVIANEFIKPNSNVVDVGAGAGFPSIPLLIMRNDLNFLIIDSVSKKVEFIKKALKQLDINRAEVVHGRCEDLANKQCYREKYDYCVSRAVAPLTSLLEYCVPFVKKTGIVVAYKGSNYNEELNNCKNTLEELKIVNKNNKEYQLLGVEGKRCIMVFDKYENTPIKYPRRQNKVRMQPLN